MRLPSANARPFPPDAPPLSTAADPAGRLTPGPVLPHGTHGRSTAFFLARPPRYDHDPAAAPRPIGRATGAHAAAPGGAPQTDRNLPFALLPPKVGLLDHSPSAAARTCRASRNGQGSISAFLAEPALPQSSVQAAA